ncbi:MAG: site-2 protease family protein [Candidatus Marinimicrobia bacterium]|jgi:membrane-associated protease RseP (regulator of RpoE activity)|nr:site-2 protease family protein [Candidatus Neomarinimicrobiota bacterium]MDP6611680.1 site-2 protease family protein [Candidatus Neomarinimicrobiota bacterium]|tara:strand:- start:6332 stop:7408 length:1077 start_codon:yes stop_codon:yes gene_type:complete
MTETQFHQILKKIDDHFRPTQIGSSEEEWLAVGRLSDGSSIGDIETILKGESCEFNVKLQNGQVFVRMKGRQEKVILRIPKIPRIHWVLFLLTVFTTLLAGAMMEGARIWENPLEIFKGIPFSLTLMLILGTHEFGHYYYAQKHKVDATLPYFIPAPPFLFLIGTFGAFIKIKSPIYRKDALLQIGAAGPIAGFVIAVPALIIGLHLSDVVDKVDVEGALMLGDSILMKLLTWITHPGLLETQDIMLHPIAFAGWIGLLVTMLNLLPIGQLDGGHVAYAMLGNKQNLVAKAALIALIPLSFLSLNWLVWGILILILMRSTKHPPIQDIHAPLSVNDQKIGFACLVIFIFCFIPAPFQI